MITKKITVKDPSGLHARRARELVDTISSCDSSVTLRHDGTEADGRSIMEIMMLAASPGSEVEVIVEGQDESDTIEQLESFFEDLDHE